MIKFKLIKEVNARPLNIEVVFLGEDIVVSLSGGDKEHIGAVSLAVPHDSFADKSKVSSTASVLCIRGHKEDEAAKRIALYLAAKLNTNVLAIVGVHYNNADMDMIKNFEKTLDDILQEIIVRLNK